MFIFELELSLKMFLKKIDVMGMGFCAETFIALAEGTLPLSLSPTL